MWAMACYSLLKIIQTSNNSNERRYWVTNIIQLHCELKQINHELKEFILYPTDRILSPVGSWITIFLTKNGCEFTSKMGEHINFFAATSNLHKNQNDYKKFIGVLRNAMDEIFTGINKDRFDIIVESKNSDYIVKII